MTVQQLINQSLIQLGVIASGESPSSDESADALTALNLMISSWNEMLKLTLAGSYASILYTFSPIATFSALGDTISAGTHPLAWQRAYVYNLAEEIASQYGREVSAAVAAKAVSSRAAVMTLPPPAA
jgi:hypothetical protein